MGIPLDDEIVPELPIKRDIVWPDHPTDKSVKVDYALFAKDRSRVFLVELKTDAGSRRDAQDDYLAAAKRVGFRAIVDGIKSIMLATNAHQKYHHLAVMLARLGYMELPADLETFLYPEVRPGLTERLKAIKVSQADPVITILYVQPVATPGDDCIDFAEFAGYIGKFSDPMSKHFSEHLLAWRTTAGASAPTSPALR